MPKSRTRKRRAKRRSAHARATRERIVSMSVGDFTRMLTKRDLELMTEAMVAEQLGDLKRALACLRRVPRPVDGPWERQLAEMVELDDMAEPWQWARFTVAAAGRWVEALPVPLVAKIQREVATAADGAEGHYYSQYDRWVAGRSALQSAIQGELL